MHQAALARQARVDTSNATNPDFVLSKDALSNTYGESAAYIIVFGDKNAGIVRKSWVEYFFGEYPCLLAGYCTLYSDHTYKLSWNSERAPSN